MLRFDDGNDNGIVRFAKWFDYFKLSYANNNTIALYSVQKIMIFFKQMLFLSYGRECFQYIEIKLRRVSDQHWFVEDRGVLYTFISLSHVVPDPV